MEGVTLTKEEPKKVGWVCKMTENELGKILKEMYDDAPIGYKVTKIHLFGFKYMKI